MGGVPGVKDAAAVATPSEIGEDEVLAVVVRTGLNTCMGSMIRQFIAPPYEYVAKDPFVKVTGACAVFKAA